MYKVAESILEGTGMTAVQTIGGANVNRQHEALKKKKPAIVIGTPGRIAELLAEGSKLKLNNIQYLVIDEVDHSPLLGHWVLLAGRMRTYADVC